MGIYRQLYLNKRFFVYWSTCIILFCFAFAFPFLIVIAQLTLMVLLGLTFLDFFILFLSKAKIKGERKLLQQLSLGDENTIRLIIENQYRMPITVRIIDELPFQLQVRDFEVKTRLQPLEKKEIHYTIKPTERGLYTFNAINIFVCSVLKIIERKIVLEKHQEVKVFPSIFQMRKYELQVFSKTAVFSGIKKVRRIGNNNEFEQIKNYVQGDDIRNYKLEGYKPTK